MPVIKPFYAFRPVLSLQGAVVTRPLENYSLGQARLMASENPYTFLHLINPELDHPYLRGSRQELIYKKIAENFESFTENDVLFREDRPAIYIYQVEHDGYRQTGIWTLTHIDAYLNNEIRKHELTVERRERLLSEYLQQTGIDANPVLMTYPPEREIERITRSYTAGIPEVNFGYQDGSIHRLWPVRDEKDLRVLIDAFSAMPCVYIADGHHRIASMAKMALRMRSVSTDYEAPFNYFSTAYFNTEQVKILAFNRLVKDLAGLSIRDFIAALKKLFDVEETGCPVQPSALHQFGMYLDKTWFLLTAKPSLYDENDPVSVLDVSILQEHVLAPLLSVHDPRTDARITFEGGKTPLSELQFQVDSGNYAVAFSLFPTTISQLMDVADQNRVMPPKSTWVEPKFLVGMLTHYFG